MPGIGIGSSSGGGGGSIPTVPTALVNGKVRTTAQVGDALTVLFPPVGLSAPTQQARRDTTAISGATGYLYTATGNDVGADITFTGTGLDGAAYTTSGISVAAVPLNVFAEADGFRTASVAGTSDVTVTGAAGTKYAGLSRTFDPALLASGPVNIGLLEPTDNRASEFLRKNDLLTYDLGLWAIDHDLGPVTWANTITRVDTGAVLSDTLLYKLEFTSGLTLRQTVTATQGANSVSATRDLLLPFEDVALIYTAKNDSSVTNPSITLPVTGISVGDKLLFSLGTAVTASDLTVNGVAATRYGTPNGTYGSILTMFTHVVQASDLTGPMAVQATTLTGRWVWGVHVLRKAFNLKTPVYQTTTTNSLAMTNNVVTTATKSIILNIASGDVRLTPTGFSAGGETETSTGAFNAISYNLVEDVVPTTTTITTSYPDQPSGARLSFTSFILEYPA